jgi:hypothetical protein
MANLEKYEEFLNESDFVNGMKFLTADEMEDLPAYKKMNSRFDVPVFNKSSKTITFSSISRKFTYPFTVSKSEKITYGTLDITPDFSMWGIDFYKSWDSIIDFLEIYMVSMGSGSNISQIRSFIKGKKALDPMIAESLKKQTCDNGDTYFDVLKEKSIKYNGEDKINSMLSAEEKKGEGLLKTLKPIVDSEFFKRLEKNVRIKYTLTPDENELQMTLQSFVSSNTSYYDSFYAYFRINPVKGNKESKGYYLIGVQDEKTMINKFIEHLVKKTSKELDKWNDIVSKSSASSTPTPQDGDHQIIAMNRRVLLEVLTLLLQNDDNEISDLINDSFNKLLKELLKNGSRSIYMMYLAVLRKPDHKSAHLFNDVFTEKELKRLYIGALYLSNGVKIFK